MLTSYNEYLEMKIIFALITSLLISGCVSYLNRTDLSNCLASGNDSNEKVTNEINNKMSIKIKNIKLTGSTQFDHDGGDGTMCPAIATYENDTSSQGFITSTGRWGRDGQKLEYKFLTVQEMQQQRDSIKKETQERIALNEATSAKIKNNNNAEFRNASVKEYPLKAEIYCYNKKTLEMYSPGDCGISAPGDIGPTNVYDDDKLTLDIMLRRHFKLKVYMDEPNPFMGIKVDIRSRETNNVLMTQLGSYTETVAISN